MFPYYEGMGRVYTDEELEELKNKDKYKYKSDLESQEQLKNESKNDTIKTYEEKVIELQNILANINETRRINFGLNLSKKQDIINTSFFNFAYSVDLKKIDNKIIDVIIQDYKNLSNEYYSTLNRIGVFSEEELYISPKAGGITRVLPKTLSGEIHFNQKIMDDLDYLDKVVEHNIKIKHFANVNSENYKSYISTHEFAHSIFNSDMLNKNLIGMDSKVYKNFSVELEDMFKEYKNKINEIDARIKELNNKFLFNTEKYTSEDRDLLKKLKQEYNEIFVSNYAIRDNLSDEFMAECFTEAKLSKNPSKTSRKVLELIDKYFKR